MSVKNRRALSHKSWWVLVGLTCTPLAYAANFYTIIGPDGHPMIIQQPEKSAKKEKVKPENIQPENLQKQSLPSQKVESKPASELNPVKRLESTPVESNLNSIKQGQDRQTAPVVNSGIQSDQAQLSEQINQDQKKSKQVGASVDHSSKQVSNTSKKIPQVQSAEASNQSSKVVSKVDRISTKQPILKSEQKTIENNQTVVEKKDNIEQKSTQPFDVIDGEKYVSNEYLEDKEFNLEGRKRFYVMPETGAIKGRMENVEREKGLSAELINRIRNKPVEKSAPIALSQTYYRLPKDEVVKNLEQSCFTGKKMDKAKGLSLKNQEVGIWPVAPIKENFAYEVVKLDANVQNVLLTSFASNKKDSTYYWPLVVFLDQQGCVVEGVSGFKSETIQEGTFSHSALEGVLKKPTSAMYLFMTPLSSAVDVVDKKLSNQGQIKLSVIQ